MSESVQDLGSKAAGPRVVASASELVAAREALGLSQGEVAQRLKLHPRQFAALEQGDWEALPGRAFVRGCVRAYGRILNADVQPLLNTIGAIAGAEALRPTTPLSEPLPRRGRLRFNPESKGGRLRGVLLGLIGVIVVVALGRHWPFSSGPTPPRADQQAETAAASTESVSPGPGAPAPVDEAPPAEGAQPLFAATGSEAGAAASAPVPARPAVVAPAPLARPESPESAAPAGSAPSTAEPAKSPAAPEARPAGGAKVPVKLSTTQESWVEVRQADGSLLFMGMVKPGQPLETSGAAPLALTIGNAEAVSLEAGGQRIDLRPLIAVPGNVARVKVP